MRLGRFSSEVNTGYALIEGDNEDAGLYEISEADFFGASLREPQRGEFFKLKDVRLLAPVMPSKIVAIGLNYRAHAAEFNQKLPDEPLFFIKPSTAVIGPGDEIKYPSDMSHRVEFEGELAVVIAKTTKDVSTTEASAHILGYTAFNDVTARDLQGRDKQWTRAKSFDTFAPMGPWIETDLDKGHIKIETFLNKERRQSTSTADMIFNVNELVSFVSKVMTLLPGDVIATGTPCGVGKMRPGDSVEVRVQGIGSLVNTVV